MSQISMSRANMSTRSGPKPELVTNFCGLWHLVEGTPYSLGCPLPCPGKSALDQQPFDGLQDLLDGRTRLG